VGVGVQWAIAVNALSFVVSFLAVRAVRVGAVRAQPVAPAIESDFAPTPAVTVDPVSTEPPTASAPPRAVRRECLDGMRVIAGLPLVLAVFVTAAS
jgi:hypothetical protein